MLDDIRLTEEHLKLLRHAAEVVGAQLDPGYLGTFRPSGSPLRCVALSCTSPGQLMHFGALVAMAFALPDHLMLTMAARLQEDGPYRPGGQRTYYWPGIVTEPGPDPQADWTRTTLHESRPDGAGGWTRTTLHESRPR